MNHANTLIIILLVANLAVTIWFGVQDKNPAGDMAGAATVHDLPAFIDRDEREKLLQNFISAFNNQDMDALYHMLGPAARAQLTQAEVTRQFETLIKFFGSVTEGAFTHSELTDTHGSAKVYVLYYRVKLSDKSQVGKKAVLNFTLAVDGDSYQVYGIHLNSNNIS